MLENPALLRKIPWKRKVWVRTYEDKEILNYVDMIYWVFVTDKTKKNHVSPSFTSAFGSTVKWRVLLGVLLVLLLYTYNPQNIQKETIKTWQRSLCMFKTRRISEITFILIPRFMPVVLNNFGALNLVTQQQKIKLLSQFFFHYSMLSRLRVKFA